VGLTIGYDEGLSHLLHGGADAILVPSRFEPCGLTQMSGLRYGCVPVVARTGGLADTVIDANIAALRAGVANGFQFSPATGEALADKLKQAISLFRDKAVWSRLRRNAMRADVSWVASARQYLELFSSLVKSKAAVA
jgi:starch synthase